MGPFQFSLYGLCTATENTEWQRPHSGEHSIMMENQPRLVRVGGARPHPLSLNVSTIICKVVEYTLAERAESDTLPLFLLYHYMYSVCTALEGVGGGHGTAIVKNRKLWLLLSELGSPYNPGSDS
jgi:hypothetical protein